MICGLRIALFSLVALLSLPLSARGQWKPHVVRQLNGSQAQIELPAEQRWITRPETFRRILLPYLVYMPEKNRLLMFVLTNGQVLSKVAQPQTVLLLTTGCGTGRGKSGLTW
jgi:hypothetical protein